MTGATLIAALLLSLVAVAHLFRVVLNIEVIVGGSVAPMWISVVAIFVAGGVAILLWRDRR